MVRPRARVRAPKGAVFFSGVGVRRGTLSSATRRGTEPRRFQKNKARVTKSATRAATTTNGAHTTAVAKTDAIRSSLASSTARAFSIHSIRDTRSTAKR